MFRYIISVLYQFTLSVIINFQEFSIIYLIMKVIYNFLFSNSWELTSLCGTERCFCYDIRLCCFVLCGRWCHMYCVLYCAWTIVRLIVYHMRWNVGYDNMWSYFIFRFFKVAVLHFI